MDSFFFIAFLHQTGNQLENGAESGQCQVPKTESSINLWSSAVELGRITGSLLEVVGFLTGVMQHLDCVHLSHLTFEQASWQS